MKNKLKNTRIVTVMFTSQSFEGNVNDMPDDCLVIARKNFEQYFGPLFSSRLIFDIVGERNLIYAEPQRIEAIIKDIGSEKYAKKDHSMALKIFWTRDGIKIVKHDLRSVEHS